MNSDGENVVEMDIEVDRIGLSKSDISDGMMIQSVGKLSDINLWSSRLTGKLTTYKDFLIKKGSLINSQ